MKMKIIVEIENADGLKEIKPIVIDTEIPEFEQYNKVNDLKNGLKQRFDEHLEIINGSETLLEEFDEQIFMRWLRR